MTVKEKLLKDLEKYKNNVIDDQPDFIRYLGLISYSSGWLIGYTENLKTQESEVIANELIEIMSLDPVDIVKELKCTGQDHLKVESHNHSSANS